MLSAAAVAVPLLRLAQGGTTKMKLARVSGARLELHERELRLDITGSREAARAPARRRGLPSFPPKTTPRPAPAAPQRSRAREYVGFVLAQRVGPVTIDFETRRNDLSVVNVPEDCVGFVMGRQGQTLRGMEEEWGTLMFFAKARAF